MWEIPFSKKRLARSCSFRHKLYFVAENLVLWARSEPLGYAVNLLQAGAE
ncbi:hypothetical protein D1AOALGA4SA_3618 [Olavius algarvensis Delta 1 endosymbiont]|nr:hypothetical protein D1AOALGA4SA_3618 [Olavius algarvensis Delta 1 endosymbiont]